GSASLGGARPRRARRRGGSWRRLERKRVRTGAQGDAMISRRLMACALMPAALGCSADRRGGPLASVVRPMTVEHSQAPKGPQGPAMAEPPLDLDAFMPL